ncbi:MAG TPA: hypothetical protein VJ853_14290, partial [Thermoanaerobaculia bacterium]|nr:hypothetical protein [Thermoanaerobaculia bacterium]
MLALFLAVALDLKSFEATEDAYLRHGRADLMLDLANRMLERPNDPNAAAYLHARGLAYSQMHLPRPAWQAFEQALPIAERSGDLNVIAEIHRDRAIWIWRFRRDRAAALKEFDQAIDCGTRAHAW